MAEVENNIHQGRSFQLTRTGNVLQFDWLDDNSLAVLRSDEKEKAQIWIFEHLLGEGLKIADHKTDVQLFKPFAGGILFLANNPKREEKESRTEKFGTFTHFEMAHPITKPRENRTVMQQNLAWFSHYLLGKKLDFYQEG